MIGFNDSDVFFSGIPEPRKDRKSYSDACGALGVCGYEHQHALLLAVHGGYYPLSAPAEAARRWSSDTDTNTALAPNKHNP